MIVACSYGFVCQSNAIEAQTNLLAVLRRLVGNNYSTWPQPTVMAGIRFVESTAWGLLWARLRYEHACEGSDLSSGELADLESALQEHFQPIFEEISPCP